MASLHPLITLQLPLNPDWFAVTPKGVWVTSSRSNVVTLINAKTNHLGPSVTIAKPCSGLAYGFRSLWIPSCGDRKVVRVDATSGKVEAEIPAGPAQSEGGITAGAGSIWIVTDKSGVLTRIDPKANKIVASIPIPSGSYNPLYADGYVWVSSNEHDELAKVDPRTNRVVATVPTGKNPRFLTYGAGSIWTLNQGDGTVSRIDTHSTRSVATVQAGISGFGGEIAFGFGSVWATIAGFPITRIDPATNKVVAQWSGAGGDSIRAALGTVWLTSYDTGAVWRFPSKIE